MWTEIYRAKEVANSGHYQINGFTVPLRSPTIIFETDDVSKDYIVKLISEDYIGLNPDKPYNTTNVCRGDFYRLASRELKSRAADLYKFSLECYPYLNKMKPFQHFQVELKNDSAVMLAFAGDGTHRAWLYIENYKEN